MDFTTMGCFNFICLLLSACYYRNCKTSGDDYVVVVLLVLPSIFFAAATITFNVVFVISRGDCMLYCHRENHPLSADVTAFQFFNLLIATSAKLH